jgi:hypothetical protein
MGESRPGQAPFSANCRCLRPSRPVERWSRTAEAEARLVRMDAVEVRRSPPARRWRLEVPWGEPARLTVPQWTSGAEVERILAEKRSWIEEQRRRQVPRLGLERLAVSEYEARIAARELVSMLAEEEADRGLLPADPDRRAADTVGIVLCARHALLQLAAGARAARGARLRGRSRALPPARPRPLAAVLGSR